MVSFDVSAERYFRFMGRFSEPLADEFAALVAPQPRQRALDVGCGPGALTARLTARLGAAEVAAIEPSTPFVAAARDRLPGVDIRQGAAEHLPYPNDAFDLACAQLVVHFMRDPVTALRELGRVTRPGGVVAACVWDYAGGRAPLSAFWQAVGEIDPDHPGEAQLAGARPGHLVALARAAGLHEPTEHVLTVRVRLAGFADWWDPFTLGVGPAGGYLAGLDDAARTQVRRRCAALVPAGPFELTASAWTMLARA